MAGTFQRLIEANIPNPGVHLQIRVDLIRRIEQVTGRKLIAYVVDFTKNPPGNPNLITVMDKTGFSDLLAGMEGEPVDVLIHSPGGSAEAAEHIVTMLRKTCPSVRFIVPHTAKSAATLMALSGDSILMDERSELGPIDPQVPVLTPAGPMYVPAQTVLDGFRKCKELLCEKGPSELPAYLPLLQKYDLHLLEICDNSIKLAKTLARKWIAEFMFKGAPEGKAVADEVADYLSDHNQFFSHGRPLGIDDLCSRGLKVENLRQHAELCDLIWELYCHYEMFFSKMPAVKIFENSQGTSWIRNAPPIPQLTLELPGIPAPPVPKPA